MPPNRSAESPAHQFLKAASLRWAAQSGYVVAAMEVRVPQSGFRADVAAARTGKFSPKQAPCAGETVIIECKQARSDFLKDSRSAGRATSELERLHERKQTLDRMLGQHFPSLRRGDSLFAEFDSMDAAHIDHDGYHSVLRRIAALNRQLYGGTKFEKLVRYCSADLLFLATPPGLILPHELPAAWGLLECDGESVRAVALPQRLAHAPDQRFRLQQAIARRATTAVFRLAGLDAAPDEESAETAGDANESSSGSGPDSVRV
jgi:hypothetical protein